MHSTIWQKLSILTSFSKASKLVIVLSVIIYPAIVYASVTYYSARCAAIWLVSLAIARFLLMNRNTMYGPLSVQINASTIALLVVALLVFALDSEIFLRFYPVFMSAFFFVVFCFTLVSPPSMIERFARIYKADFSTSEIAYLRNVTRVWCWFFLCNGLISLYSSLEQSLEFWAVYNGFISYCIMGLIFFGELIARRHLMERVKY